MLNRQATFSFRVVVNSGSVVINAAYGVSSAEGVMATGLPLVTPIRGGYVFLPVIVKP